MSTTRQHRVATCKIGDEPILVPCTGIPDRLALLARQATQEHLPTLLRLPGLEAACSALGDQERRGLHTLDEVLGSAAMCGLWLDANRCGGSHCRHAA